MPPDGPSLVQEVGSARAESSSAAKPGTLIIDELHSLARSVGVDRGGVRSQGHRFYHVPVSGGEPKAVTAR